MSSLSRLHIRRGRFTLRLPCSFIKEYPVNRRDEPMLIQPLRSLLLGAAASAGVALTAIPAEAGTCLEYYWCGPGHPGAVLSGAAQTPPGHPPLPTDRQYWTPRHYGHWYYWGFPRVRGYSQNPVYIPYNYGQGGGAPVDPAGG